MKINDFHERALIVFLLGIAVGALLVSAVNSGTAPSVDGIGFDSGTPKPTPRPASAIADETNGAAPERAIDDPGPTTYEMDDGTLRSSEIALIIYERVNNIRDQHGYERLFWNDSVASAARAHSAEMAEHGYVGHRAPDGGTVEARYRTVRVDCSVVAENVGLIFGDQLMQYQNGELIHLDTNPGIAFVMMELLLDSPAHRANILSDDVTHIGIGVHISPSHDGDGAAIHVTQGFCNPPGSDKS